MNSSKQAAKETLLGIILLFALSAFLFLCVFLIKHFESYTLSPEESGLVPEHRLSQNLAVAETGTAGVPYITDVRRIAEHKNGIGIFDSSGKLLEVYPLDVTRLTPADRQILKDGMLFDGEGELRDFLESLDS